MSPKRPATHPCSAGPHQRLADAPQKRSPARSCAARRACAHVPATPIIVGLAGFNTAYVLQGAVVVALVAVVVDLGFERMGTRWGRWRAAV